MSKILAQFKIFIGRSHNDTCINASNVSSFNRLLQSLFAQLCLEKPHSHIVVFAKPKLQLVPSRNCMNYWNLEVSARVPRLESSYFSICKFQPLYFMTCSVWRCLHYEGWKLCRAHFCKVTLPPEKFKINSFIDNFDDQNGI